MRLLKTKDNHFQFYCEGCKQAHRFNDTWQFDGNFENPTVSPSILVTMPRGNDNEDWICHSFIKGGNIQYLNDCSHELAGKTIKLLDESEWWG